MFEAYVADTGEDAAPRPATVTSAGRRPQAIPDDSYIENLIHLEPAQSDAAVPPAEILSMVADYRLVGWFQSYETWSDAELATSVWALYQENFGVYGPRHKLSDEFMIGYDGDRSLTFDAEAGVDLDSIYGALLKALAQISGGAHGISAISQDWTDDWVVLSFELNGQPVSMTLVETEDWINPLLVTELNKFLPDGGPRYWFVDAGEQMAILTRATDEERRSLESRLVRFGCRTNLPAGRDW